MKGIDASSLPPCKKVLEQKLARAGFVARMWHAACDQMIVKHPESGWELSDGSYSLVWFIGPQMPDSVIPDPDDGSADEMDNDSETSDSDINNDGE